MATLYEIENEILALIDPETGEITDFEAFEKLQLDREQKLENAALLIKNCEADIAAYKAEQAVFDKKIDRAKRTLESVKKYLSEALGGENFKTSKVTCSFRKSPSVEILDAKMIPQEFLRVKEPEPNKEAIKMALKSGFDVMGARLVIKQSMSVK